MILLSKKMCKKCVIEDRPETRKDPGESRISRLWTTSDEIRWKAKVILCPTQPIGKPLPRTSTIPSWCLHRLEQAVHAGRKK